MTNLLAFDTATERLHIGLAVDDVQWVHDGEGGAQASSALIPAARRLLDEAGIGWADLDAIAFGRGPGAFTGLRTACAAAQGFALGAARPVLPIDTLLAVAEHVRQGTGATDVWVAMDARMEEIYAAHYRFADGRWQTVDDPALYGPEALLARWRADAPQMVAGTALAHFGARLDPGAGCPRIDAGPSASALLACARDAWQRGLAVDAAQARPLYLRDRVALTTAEREARRPA